MGKEGEDKSDCLLHHMNSLIILLYFSQGTHTIAVVNGPESHETLAESFRDVFVEANEIQDRGYITVDGKQVDIELFLGGDYKVRITSTNHKFTLQCGKHNELLLHLKLMLYLFDFFLVSIAGYGDQCSKFHLCLLVVQSSQERQVRHSDPTQKKIMVD